MVLKDETIDKTILNVKGLDYLDKQTLINVSDKPWFRSYARQSREALSKILKKVKKGIRKGGYTYFGKPVEEPRGYLKPKPKKEKGKKKPTEKKKRAGKKKAEKPVSPKTKSRMESAKRKYPDATKYEWQHGVNSKASQKYRQAHNRPAKYEGRIKG